MGWIGFLVLGIASGIGAFAVTRWRNEKIPIWKGLGLEFDAHATADLAAGIVIGSLAMVGVFGVEWALGVLQVRGFQPPDIVWYLWFPLLAILVFGEEIAYRSLMLNGLQVILGKAWMAVFIMAAAFGLAHAGNPNATILSVLGNALGGLVYGIAFLGSRRIWLPLGLHFAWNFVQAPVLGFPILGREIGLLQITSVGNVIFNGGSYGPEAGLIGMASRFFVITLLFIWFWWRSKVINQERSE